MFLLAQDRRSPVGSVFACVQMLTSHNRMPDDNRQTAASNSAEGRSMRILPLQSRLRFLGISARCLLANLQTAPWLGEGRTGAGEDPAELDVGADIGLADDLGNSDDSPADFQCRSPNEVDWHVWIQ